MAMTGVIFTAFFFGKVNARGRPICVPYVVDIHTHYRTFAPGISGKATTIHLNVAAVIADKYRNPTLQAIDGKG